MMLQEAKAPSPVFILSDALYAVHFVFIASLVDPTEVSGVLRGCICLGTHIWSTCLTSFPAIFPSGIWQHGPNGRLLLPPV